VAVAVPAVGSLHMTSTVFVGPVVASAVFFSVQSTLAPLSEDEITWIAYWPSSSSVIEPSITCLGVPKA
jgi:hypothetical protein